jgi:3-isopropylmalate/(R)-2-methylmalate dehydratase large subunit
LFDKIWARHVVWERAGEPTLLYVDRHLIHEVTSPQAFDALRARGRKVRRPELTFATVDHNVPTHDRRLPIVDQISKRQMDALAENCRALGIEHFDLHNQDQGIVHVIGPELGISQPGQVIVCGDSHTSTHGALGAFAIGIGTSEVEHVLATQCLWQTKPKTLAIVVEGDRQPGVTAKDLILAIIGRLGVGGGTGCAIEYRGETIGALGIEARMTVCNMTVEAGARAGMIAPDDKTFAFLEGRPYAPKGRALDAKIAEWRMLATEADARFDREVRIEASSIAPQVTWGTNPGMVTDVSGRVPDPAQMKEASERHAAERALAYMGLVPNTPIVDIAIDRVFIGSCTNARLSDLVEAARIVDGKRVHRDVRALVVPGSQRTKRAAEAEGLHEVFLAAGFEWREPGCSMCLGMNEDNLAPKERCASTSNRNFEGRQGREGRTHLVSPAMAAAAAIEGHFVDVRRWR